MTRISEIIRELEMLAPPALQESYDNAGLITGNKDAETTGVLVCLDTTEAVIEEAVEKGCNLIVAHHPVIFGGLKQITGRNYIERVIIRAIRNDIAIYAAHTNLDNVPEGVNRMIAKRLGIINTRILAPRPNGLLKLVVFTPEEQVEKVRQAIFSAGAGRIGNYDSCSFNAAGTGTFRAGSGADPFVGEIGNLHYENEIRTEAVLPRHLRSRVVSAMIAAHPYEEVAYDLFSLENEDPVNGSGMIGELPEARDEISFLKMLKEKMETGCVRHTALLGKPVKKIAFCGGAGSFLLHRALAAGADVFITGDFKYHQFFDAEGRLVIADVGHYESERFTVDLLSGFLKEKFSTFAVRNSEVNTNPINYF